MQLYDEKWELIADELTTEQRPSRGGGEKRRRKTSKTPASSGIISVENSERKRARRLRQSIRSFLPQSFFKEKFEHLYLPDYKKWVLASLSLGRVVINEKDIDFDASRASGHGGQNVNKTSSVPIYTHLPTGRAVESSVTPHQFQNRGYAMEVLVEDLNEHFRNWLSLAELKHINLKDKVVTSEFISETLETIKIERKK